jgi:hypothetical protein
MSDAAVEKKHRSPAYPFISLRKAVERAEQFYRQERRHAAHLSTAAKHWGYKEKSSGGLQTISALKQFGLLEDEGSGGDRRVKLTDLAFAILLDEVSGSPERAAALKKAALSPKLYAEMFAKWGIALPSDENIRTFLKRDKSFNDEAVTGVIKDFRDTLEYSKLGDADTIAGKEEGDVEIPPAVAQPHMQDVQPLTPTTKPAIQPPVPIGSAREISLLNEGEAVLQWPASISLASVEELEEWLSFVVRKLKRRAQEA